jgi:phage host-nuclease inhibitor protein Gam
MDPRETAIAQAIADLNAGIHISQRAAAKAYGIPRATLQERLKGRTNRSTCHQHQQRLSPEQEQFLVEWILKEDGRACPPSHARAREMATVILRTNGDLDPLGKQWLLHFMKRNPRAASVVGKKIDARRAEAATPEQLRESLERFERTRQRLNIPKEAVYNMDETGVPLGICPSNAELGTGSSQVQQRPSTPPPQQQPQSLIDSLYATPKTAQDIYRAQQQLYQLGDLTRNTRVVLRKVAKALSAANAKIAALEEEHRQLLHELEAIRPSMPRKRVRIEPGEQFANTENVMGALNQPVAEQVRRSRRSSRQVAEKPSRDVSGATFESMCFEWQLPSVDY